MTNTKYWTRLNSVTAEAAHFPFITQRNMLRLVDGATEFPANLASLYLWFVTKSVCTLSTALFSSSNEGSLGACFAELLYAIKFPSRYFTNYFKLYVLKTLPQDNDLSCNFSSGSLMVHPVPHVYLYEQISCTNSHMVTWLSGLANRGHRLWSIVSSSVSECDIFFLWKRNSAEWRHGFWVVIWCCVVNVIYWRNRWTHKCSG